MLTNTQDLGVDKVGRAMKHNPIPKANLICYARPCRDTRFHLMRVSLAILRHSAVVRDACGSVDAITQQSRRPSRTRRDTSRIHHVSGTPASLSRVSTTPQGCCCAFDWLLMTRPRACSDGALKLRDDKRGSHKEGASHRERNADP